jgi:hypothetical protein
MHKQITAGVIAIIALTAITTMEQAVQSQLQKGDQAVGGDRAIRQSSGVKAAAPPAITGDNVYVAWWTNETGNDEVMFRASTDAGQTIGDRINLSNTTDADSTRVEIDSDADSVVVSWWETNQTDDTPVMRVSNDNGATFGPLLTLATNGTLGEASEGEGEEED